MDNFFGHFLWTLFVDIFCGHFWWMLFVEVFKVSSCSFQKNLSEIFFFLGGGVLNVFGGVKKRKTSVKKKCPQKAVGE